MFWLHDSHHDGSGISTWRHKWFQTALSILTVVLGLFICVAGLYVNIRAIIQAYTDGSLAAPFTC